MAFWSDSNLREPLRQNRWYITFAPPTVDGEQRKKGIENYRFALKECSKPEYKIETTSHVLINHTFNYPKNLVWQPVQIKMVSARGEQGDTLSSVLESYLTFFGYIRPDSDEEQKQIAKASTFTPRIVITQIDANGAVIENWVLYNPFITNVNYGQLTYINDDFVDVTYTILYDYATLATYPGIVDISLTSTTTSGAPGSVTTNYKKVTEEQVAEKILNKARQLDDTEGQIKTISSISPGFPGKKN